MKAVEESTKSKGHNLNRHISVTSLPGKCPTAKGTPQPPVLR
jgi:hypothetical protein